MPQDNDLNSDSVLDSSQDRHVLKSLGCFIHDRRVKEGISQEELSKRSGISRYYISSIERGAKNVTVVVLRKLAAVLNVKAWQILQKAEQDIELAAGSSEEHIGLGKHEHSDGTGRRDSDGGARRDGTRVGRVHGDGGTLRDGDRIRHLDGDGSENQNNAARQDDRFRSSG